MRVHCQRPRRFGLGAPFVATVAFGADFGFAATRGTACAFGTFFFRSGVLLAAGRGGDERLATGRSSVTNAADQSVRT